MKYGMFTNRRWQRVPRNRMEEAARQSCQRLYVNAIAATVLMRAAWCCATLLPAQHGMSSYRSFHLRQRHGVSPSIRAPRHRPRCYVQEGSVNCHHTRLLNAICGTEQDRRIVNEVAARRELPANPVRGPCPRSMIAKGRYRRRHSNERRSPQAPRTTFIELRGERYP